MMETGPVGALSGFQMIAPGGAVPPGTALNRSPGAEVLPGADLLSLMMTVVPLLVTV